MCKKNFFNQSGQIWGKKENTTTGRNQFYDVNFKNSKLKIWEFINY